MTQTNTPSTTDSEARLRIALVSGIAMAGVGFLVGATSMWALAHWSATPGGAVAGASLALTVGAALVRNYWRTQGRMHRWL